MATRLAFHVPAWVGLDQVGFVPGREAKDNTPPHGGESGLADQGSPDHFGPTANGTS